MGIRIIVREDGTVVKVKSPRRGVPMYSDWLRLLLSRKAAYVSTEVVCGQCERAEGRCECPVFDKMHSTHVPKIVPFTAEKEQAHFIASDGQAMIYCLGCGEPTTFLDLGKGTNKIRIGGLIQLPHEEVVGEWEREVSYRIQPVSKSGLGCPKCMALFTDVESKTMDLNRKRREYDLSKAYLAVAHA